MNKHGERTLAEALATSKEEGRDLIECLVSSGVNCMTCYMNPNQRGWSDGGLICKKEGGYVVCPELSVCLKWRESGIEVARYRGGGRWR